MKKQSYLPLNLLKSVTMKYPKAWGQMKMFHDENGIGDLPSWPRWCYAPMGAAIAVVAEEKDFDNLPTAEKMLLMPDIQSVFALAPWRLSKEVYVIDPDLKNLLFEQDSELNVPDEVLLQLPYQCFYVEIPNTYFINTKIHGFFVTLEYDTENADRELKPVFLTEDGEVFSFSIHIGCRTIAESVSLLHKQALKNVSDSQSKKIIWSSMQHTEEIESFLKKILQIVLYILAQNAEITPNSEQAFITKRGQTIRDKYSEIRKWDVGTRVGSAIRQQKVKEQLVDKERQEGSMHQSPRPHMRRGHWHHFWTGPKAKPEERKLILKWLSPMVIAASPDDTPVVFHEVK